METKPFIQLGTTAHAALQHTHSEAERLGHDYIGTEHLLLSLALCRSLVLNAFFGQHRGLTYENFNREVLTLIGRDKHHGAMRRRQTPALELVFERARTEYELHRLGGESIEIEHYLLALVPRDVVSYEQGPNKAAVILGRLGVDFKTAYDGIVAAIDAHPIHRRQLALGNID